MHRKFGLILELRLEIDNGAWFGYGGVVSVDSGVAVHVRLVGRDSCRTYVNFLAPPGTNWVIRFVANGFFLLEDWTGRGMDAGPGLVEREPSGCPDSGPGIVTTTLNAQEVPIGGALSCSPASAPSG